MSEIVDSNGFVESTLGARAFVEAVNIEGPLVSLSVEVDSEGVFDLEPNWARDLGHKLLAAADRAEALA